MWHRVFLFIRMDLVGLQTFQTSFLCFQCSESDAEAGAVPSLLMLVWNVLRYRATKRVLSQYGFRML